MPDQTTRYGLSITLPLPYAEAVERTRAALGEEGFGILTEIDVAATLRNKLGVDFRPYIILGACNPGLAHRGLQAELDLGLLLPCNVIVYQAGDPERSVVAVMDPEAALSLAGNAELRPVAGEARERLLRALDALGRSGGAGG